MKNLLLSSVVIAILFSSCSKIVEGPAEEQVLGLKFVDKPDPAIYDRNEIYGSSWRMIMTAKNLTEDKIPMGYGCQYDRQSNQNYNCSDGHTASTAHPYYKEFGGLKVVARANLVVVIPANTYVYIQRAVERNGYAVCYYSSDYSNNMGVQFYIYGVEQ